ncbi:30S ribosomal protein S5 [Candidatus Gugararchaeum adminiculabundum]|nr:30S ribosomal protein S5 [Candidatus Gugararchaeum adminiculabundum]
MDDEAEWIPKTEVGAKVKSKEIISLREILEQGKPILEYQIVDFLLPELKEEVLGISSTQRMTANGRKMQYRAIVVIGDTHGYVGFASGKADEARPAIETALRNAKKAIAYIPFGCGSWECGCGAPHSIPIKLEGKSGSVKVTLKPAPRGVGIAGNDIVKKVLGLAGVKDVWSQCRGKTATVYNNTRATFNALNSLNRMRYHGEFGAKKESV